MKRLIGGLLLWLLLASQALAFGPKGHQVVGFAADVRLSSARARRELRHLLRRSETLADASTWADRIKGGGFDAESRAFLRRNPRHGDFHFVNLHHQRLSYDPKAIGARNDDLVQMLTTCVKVLQDRSDRFSRREALLLLTHYAGDIHQPLHVGCGYIARVGSDGFQFVDPEVTSGAELDRGGNSLLIDPLVPGGRRNLHAFWDDDAVERATRGASPRQFARALVRFVPVEPGWRSSGAPDTWAPQWAADSLRRAAAAYSSITLGQRHQKPGKAPVWDASLPSNYLDEAGDAVRIQMAKAGFRLAAMLDAIWPD